MAIHTKNAAFIVAADLLALTLSGAARRDGRRYCHWHYPALWHAACAMVARTQPTWRAVMSTNAPCPAVWWASAWTPMATRPTAWRCKRASSTSAAKKPPPTSAPRRSCPPWWPACTPSTTGPQGLTRIAQRVATLHRYPGQRSGALGFTPCTTKQAFDTLCYQDRGCYEFDSFSRNVCGS
jgi:hypothetical protein